MGSGNDSILDMYLYETNTLLEQLDGILLASEQADTFSQDSVNEIFRIMHTIKGSSAMMEFNSLMTVAHRIEDLFFIIREKTIDVVPEALRPELFDMIFQAVDFFRGEIEKVENGEALSDSIDSIVDKINSLIDKIQGGGDAAAERAPAAQLPRQPGGRVHAVGGGLPGTHHGDGHLLVKGELPPLPVQHHGRLVDGLQPLRVGGVLEGQQADAQPVAVPQNPVRPVQGLLHQGTDRLPAQPAQGLKGTPVGGVYLLRTAEPLQQAHGDLPRNPPPLGEPDPVLQI